MDHFHHVKGKIHKISIQDVLIVLVCISAVYLLRSRDTYDIVPVWRKELNIDYYQNGKFPGSSEKMPLPIVTDIESDGLMEIIMITNDYKLEIYVSPQQTKHAETNRFVLPYLVPVRSVSLNLHTTTEGAVPYPVVLRSGFIDQYFDTDTSQLRKQIIVIGLSNWTVLCFDSQLKELWSTHLLDDLTNVEDHYQVEAMAITVTSYSLQKYDKGSVFVGINMEHSHDTNSKTNSKHKNPRMHQMGAKIHSHESNTDRLSHFSTFALSGKTGVIIWHNKPKALEMNTKQKSGVFTHWKLNIHDSSTHAGEVHWTKHIKNILQHMPHHWSQLDDTAIELTDLKQTPKSQYLHSDGKAAFSPLTDVLGLDNQHIAGLPFGGMRPHNPHEHISTPSSLFIHSHKGIEILQIETGKHVTHLKLSSDRCTYADIDSDGTLDSMCLESCTATAQTMYPAQNEMYSGPVCESPSIFGPVSFMAAVTSHRYLNEDRRLALPPLLVKSVGKRSGILSHLMGRTLKSERKGYDSVFLTSSGRLTSYAPHGQLNWQVIINSGWDSYFTGQGSHLQMNYHEREEMYNGPFQPSMEAFSPLDFGKQTYLLAFGWSSMTIVDLYDGYSLSDNTLPCQPIQKPVIADFNGDGKNDIIIPCSFGYIGVTIEHTKNYIYTAVTAVCVVAVIFLLSWCCQPEVEESRDEHQHRR